MNPKGNTAKGLLTASKNNAEASIRRGALAQKIAAKAVPAVTAYTGFTIEQMSARACPSSASDARLALLVLVYPLGLTEPQLRIILNCTKHIVYGMKNQMGYLQKAPPNGYQTRTLAKRQRVLELAAHISLTVDLGEFIGLSLCPPPAKAIAPLITATLPAALKLLSDPWQHQITEYVLGALLGEKVRYSGPAAYNGAYLLALNPDIRRRVNSALIAADQTQHIKRIKAQAELFHLPWQAAA